jgi:hypothetical protein
METFYATRRVKVPTRQRLATSRNRVLVRQESLGAWNRPKRRSDVKLREGPGG